MAGIGAYLAQLVLNATLKNTASLASPAALFLGVASGTPSSVSMSEVGTGSGYTPQTVTFSSVGANGTKATNANAVTFGTMSSNFTPHGFFLKDSASGANLGHMLYFATVGATIVSRGDTIVVAAGSLTISLS